MAEPFSIFAGAVGVTDAALKGCVKGYQFLSDIKDAPAEMHTLRDSLKENMSLVTILRKHIQDMRNPASATFLSAKDLLPAIEHFSAAVTALQKHSSTLSVQVAKYKGRKTWSNVKWVLDKQKLQKLAQQMEQTKTKLHVAMSLIKGKRSVIAHRRIEEAIEQSSLQTTSKLGDVQKSQDTILEQNKNLVSCSLQQVQSAKSIQRELQRFRLVNQKQHEHTENLISKSTKMIVRSLEINSTSSNRDNALKTSYRLRTLIGTDCETLLKHLHYMEGLVQKVIWSAIFQPYCQNIGWLQSEFEALIRSTIREISVNAQGSSTASLDRWVYLTGGPTSLYGIQPRYRVQPQEQHPIQSDGKSIPLSSAEIIPRPPETQNLFRQTGSTGELLLRLSSPIESKRMKHSVSDVHLLYIPAPDLGSIALAIRIVRTLSNNVPKLHTQLSACRLSGTFNEYWKIIAYCTLEQLDDAIRGGQISPYDQLSGKRGYVMKCYWLVGKCFRADILHYLDSQGVRVSNVSGEIDVLMGIWSSMQSERIGQGSICEETLSVMLSYVEKSSTFCISTTETALLHASSWNPRRGVTAMQIRMIERWIKFLKCHGYDFEKRENSRTPLLDHLLARGGASLAISRTLVEFGADVHAVDSDRRNALQLAMESNTIWSHYPFLSDPNEFPDILLAKFEFLIKAAADLHHRDSFQETPSCSARWYNCWGPWCEALQRCGLKIEEVVRHDTEEWLLGDDWEEYYNHNINLIEGT